MDRSDYFLIGILVLVLAGLAYVTIGWFWSPSISAPAANTVATGGFATIDSGTTDTGDVSIALTPRGMQDGMFTVDLATNTHSVALEPFDLSELTTLTVDGEDYKPALVPTLSGHHASGTLAFALDTVPKTFTITIVGIPAVETRVFRWSS